MKHDSSTIFLLYFKSTITSCPITRISSTYVHLRAIFSAGSDLACSFKSYRLFQAHPRYQRFPAAGDEYTMVLLPRGAEAESFSGPVLPALKAALSAQASAETAKAWSTTSARVAVVRVTLGGRRVTAASVHCNKHESTADLLVALKGILEREAPADFFVIGCDTNVPWSYIRFETRT